MAGEGEARLRQLVEGARSAVVFTGAGISTDSGIPDFRSPTGLWKTQKPIPFDEFVGSPEVRRAYWARRFSGDRTLADARPNDGHRAVAELVRRGHVALVVTQNVDDLHRRSGVPDERLVELHGNAHHARCLSCGRRYELDALETDFREHGEVPPCAACGGIVKTATISFGQAMPEDEMARAEAATRACDLFLVLGSFLSVYPAAAFPEFAARLGTPLVIVNREPTPQDELATVVLHQGVSEALAFAVPGTGDAATAPDGP